jgi:hypothetical protein
MRQHALPVLTPVSAELIPRGDVAATQQALAVLQKINSALAANDAEALENCFYAEQAFWKDQLALTWHLRTFISPTKITSALLEIRKLRNLTGNFEIRDKAHSAQVGPTLVSWLHLHYPD